MNGIEKISARILADAEAEAAAIRAQADEKAAQIRAEYDRKIETEQQRLTLEAQNEAQKQLERGQGAARMAARRQLLEKKQALVDKAFRTAEQKLLSLPEADYTRLCAQLAAFPILIIFETQIRMKLLHFLQLLANAFPTMIASRPSLVLLFCELQFWFRKNRARLRTQPFYSFINAGQARPNVSPSDYQPDRFFALRLQDAAPLTRLRYAYLQYQQLLQNTSPQARALHRAHLLQFRTEAFAALREVLEAVQPATPLNTMVSFRQNVILTDNSPVCANQGVLGVMLPFYGSSSFLTSDAMETQMKSDAVSAAASELGLRLRAVGWRKESQAPEAREEALEVLERCEAAADNPDWLLYLR